VKLRSLVALLFATLTVTASLAVGSGAALASDAVPYKDPGASGTVTLCNKDLQPITDGNVNDLPFIWRAVGSEEAPAPYNNENRRAVLSAAQPRKGVDPTYWTTFLLANASTYKDVAHPMSQFTGANYPLSVYLKAYPPQWDGFVQLRLSYTTFNAPESTAYAAVNIQVQGDTWHAVDAGTSDCGSVGDATSTSTLLPGFKQQVKKVQKQFASKAPTSSSPSAQSSSSPKPSSSTSSDAAGPTSPSSSTGSTDNGPSRAWVSLAVLAALAAAGGAAAWVWRRQSASS
jgi:hypothetical protein